MALTFKDVIGELKDETKDIKEKFNSGKEGKGIRQITEAARQKGSEYSEKLIEAIEFVGSILNGRRPVSHLKEAMTTSDFPYLFGDILDRQLLAGYREYPTAYKAFARIGTVPDFRTVNRFTSDGGDGRLDQVEEKENYPYGSISEGRYQYSVKKYGRKFDFSWEAMVNDDLDAFADMPQRLGKAARRAEEYFATDLFVGTAGPDTTFFHTANYANIVTSNPVLSVAGLGTAMTILGNQKDAGGEPIFTEAVILAVPPALEVTALNILNALQIEMIETGGTTNQKIIAQNWMKNRMQLVVLPYLPIIADTNGATSWFLFTNPATNRGALEMGFLRGYNEPQVFMKSSNQLSIGGGDAGPFGGDFDSDSIEYKVRHIFGGVLLDPKCAVASNGSGS